MSSRARYRPPAWAGLDSAAQRFVPVQPSCAETICRALGRPGEILRREDGGDEPIFFRFLGAEGRDDFLKLVPPQRFAAMERAERIAQWLAADGARVVAAYDAEPTLLEDGRGLYAYRYLDSRFARPDGIDLQAIGAALARLHRALSRHEDCAAWRRATDERLARLGRVRQDLASGLLRSGPDPAHLAELARDPGLDFAAGERRVALHGDLNLFNVLIAGTDVWFVDFEDVWHNVLPVELELALVCERFVLTRVDDASAAAAALGEFLAAYRSAGGHEFAPVSRFPTVLRSRALGSLCTLAEAERRGETVDTAEWRKFLHLEKLAGSRGGREWWPCGF